MLPLQLQQQLTSRRHTMQNELNVVENNEASDQDTGLVEEHLTVEIPTEIQAGAFGTSWGCKYQEA
jgi:hypothetical protein